MTSTSPDLDAPTNVPNGAAAAQSLRSRWESAALWFWLLLGVAIAVRIGVVEPDPRRNNVYLKVFAAAGEAFWHGEDLYVRPDGSNFGFRYPPLAAAAFVPFAVCGPILGSLLWRGLSFAALLLALLQCFRAGLPLSMNGRERGIVLFIVALIGITSLNNGQTNPLILALCLLATSGTLAGRARQPAAAITGCVALKVYPIAYGAVLCVIRPRQIAWLVGLIVVAGLLPFALQKPAYVAEQYGKLWHLLGAEDRINEGVRNAYRDLRLVFASVGLTLPTPVFHVLQLLVGGAIAGTCVALQRAGAGARVVLEYGFSLTMCWTMLLGPATEKATYILTAPSLAWILVRGLRSGHPGWLGAALLANGLALAAALLPVDRDYADVWLWFWCLLPYSSLVLLVTLALRAISDLRQLRHGHDLGQDALDNDNGRRLA